MSDLDQTKTPGAIYWQRKYAKAEQRIAELEAENLQFQKGELAEYTRANKLRADNERLRKLLDEALSVTDGLGDDSYFEPEHRACMISWRDDVKAALQERE